jgi:hypothetical protein
MEGITYQPLDIPNQDIEDAPDWKFFVFLWGSIVKAAKPFILSILFLYLLWPKEINYDVF